MVNAFQLAGYEDLELSTQILIREALKINLKVDVLDREANFIRLSKGKKIEYVKEATKTSADSYICALIMENKIITKRILEEHGLNVPKGASYDNFAQAIRDILKFSKKKIIIKPRSTNFGIGITIVNPQYPNFKIKYAQACKNAFQHDSVVLIENFIEGKEYRFLVIKDKVIAVLNRKPANIIGDGKHTIKELAMIKNRSPFRGENNSKPLEFIQFGETEKKILQEQNLTFENIPPKGRTIYLRKNSNISTGGDSIDFTDTAHNDYKKIALKAVKAVKAKICGLDMIVKDIKKLATKENYTIIELNFNPAIHIHTYPYIGKNREPAKFVLDMLGF